MARINIEDSLFSDQRFINLVEEIGSYDTAIGIFVRAMRLAQKYYLEIENDRLIPIKEWERGKFQKLVDNGLAEIREKGVYLKGSGDQFRWLAQKKEAGKKSAESRAASKNSNENQHPLDSVQRPFNESQRPLDSVEQPLNENQHPLDSVQREEDFLQPLTLTLTPTLAPAPTPTLAPVLSNTSRGTREHGEKALNKKIWQSYQEAYYHRYGANPLKNAKSNSIIDQLRKRVGEEAISLVRFYLSHNDSWYLKKTHSLDLCLKDAETLHTQWQRNRPITQTDIRNYEKQSETDQILKTIREDGI